MTTSAQAASWLARAGFGLFVDFLAFTVGRLLLCNGSRANGGYKSGGVESGVDGVIKMLARYGGWVTWVKRSTEGIV